VSAGHVETPAQMRSALIGKGLTDQNARSLLRMLALYDPETFDTLLAQQVRDAADPGPIIATLKAIEETRFAALHGLI
jgi:hypothetical protein